MNSAHAGNHPTTEVNLMQSISKSATARILSAAAVRVGSDRVPVGRALEEACAANPRIETRQRNGAISEIVITCGCGQQTVIECDYNEAAVRTVKV